MAKLFLYPSLRESFGIPIVEAMACGTPVITSNTSSMPEVAGNAAKLVNPHDPDDVAKNVHEVLSDSAQQTALSSKGLLRAKEFSWANSAAKVLALYEEVLSEK